MAKTYTQHKLSSALALTLYLGACSSSPSVKYQQKSQTYNFSERTISTQQFDHAIFSNRKVATNTALHIYIEGDGQPFIHKRYISKDPTSNNATSLKLMHKDPSQSVLIGRPCYHARQADNCRNNKWWTSHRYSAEVVNSMADAIKQVNHSDQDIVLIGLSGGGSLAMLLASKVENLKKIITINANLDIDAWTQKHSYTPLSGSLNPIDYLAQAAHISQVHLIGGRDANIPHASWRSKIKGTKVTIVPYSNFTHTCCWETVWQQILNQHATDF